MLAESGFFVDFSIMILIEVWVSLFQPEKPFFAYFD